MDVAKLSKSPKEGLRKAKSLSSPLRTTVKTRLGPDSDASHGAAATGPVTGDSHGVPVTGMAPRTRPPKLEGKA